ncbi:MAG TPA: nucleoside monophosphate kinase [Candidatus Babeliales bacterium]|nr:nucleoside monophosphate kinase [Candidatus Babeliales bacterium]
MTEDRQQQDIVIFIAPPGAGKGSISQKCIEDLGWEQLSTGNLCRKHIEKGTELGQKIDFAIKSGRLVSDDLIVAMVREWFQENPAKDRTVLLDGFPRTVPQAMAFKAMLALEFPLARVRVVQLRVSDEELIRRLTSRLTCSDKNCQQVYSLLESSGMVPKVDMECDLCQSRLTQRSDDNITTVRDRLSNYYRHEDDLLDYYSSIEWPIIQVNVESSLDKVFDQFKSKLDV